MSQKKKSNNLKFEMKHFLAMSAVAAAVVFVLIAVFQEGVFASEISLTYSADFTEDANANDGSFTEPIVITLTGDSFVPAPGLPLEEGVYYEVAELPLGLELVIEPADATQLIASLTGNAIDHALENSNSFSLTFLDAIFTTATAAEVTNSQAWIAVDFTDAVADGGAAAAAADGFSYSATTVNEEQVTDNGTFSESIDITLTGDTFVAGDLVEGVHYGFSGVPDGLTAALAVNAEATQVTMTFSGQAVSHDSASGTSGTLEFYGMAVNSGDVSAFEGASTIINFEFYEAVDGGDAAAGGGEAAASNQITYDASELNEDANTNIGSFAAAIRGQITSSDGSVLFAQPDTTLTQDVHYTFEGVPDGLTPQVSVDSPGEYLTIQFTGNAINHASADTTTATFTLLEGTIENVVTVSVVDGYTKSFQFTFTDGGDVAAEDDVDAAGGGDGGRGGDAGGDADAGFSYSAQTFTESASDVGRFTGSITVSTGALGIPFLNPGTAMTEGEAYTVTGLPNGLTLVITPDEATDGATATMTLQGSATAHTVADSGSFTVSFLASSMVGAPEALFLALSGTSETISYDFIGGASDDGSSDDGSADGSASAAANITTTARQSVTASGSSSVLGSSGTQTTSNAGNAAGSAAVGDGSLFVSVANTGGVVKKVTAAAAPVLKSVVTAAGGLVTRGSAGTPVRELQNALNQSGALPTPLAADGFFGPLTQGAVELFQSAAGIATDGIVGPETFGALFENGF